MSNNLHIRNLDDQEISWLKKTIPPGVSQNDFLKNLLVDARERHFEYPTFTNSSAPQIIYRKTPFKFIDLFAGIGGFRCGMTIAGGECVFTSEWDKYAIKTYKSWYGEKEIFTDDIRNINPSTIPDHDVLCAGFPCQPFSIAGVSKKNSLGVAHGFDEASQGNLFFTILDIVKSKRPPVLFLENVKNLKSHDKGKTWKIIQEKIKDENYAIFTEIIDARYWVPQHRERIFIVCFDKNIFGQQEEINFTFPKYRKSRKITLKKILSNPAPDKKYMLSNHLWKYLQDYAKKHKAQGHGFGFDLNGPDDVARTMSARYYKDGSEILIKEEDWKNPRRLTPVEAMYLMGYTTKYSKLFGHEKEFPIVVSDTQAYKQFGNSVVPPIVEQIAHKIVETMNETVKRVGSGCMIKDRL